MMHEVNTENSGWYFWWFIILASVSAILYNYGITLWMYSMIMAAVNLAKYIVVEVAATVWAHAEALYRKSHEQP